MKRRDVKELGEWIGRAGSVIREGGLFYLFMFVRGQLISCLLSKIDCYGRFLPTSNF